MTRFKYILKTFIHYFKANLLVAIGVAVSTTVLTGSLIIGDSVRYSLEQNTFYRLGETTHLVSVTERYFRQEMAAEIEADHAEIKAAPVLLLEGMVTSGGGEQRANRVQILGVEKSFQKISKTGLYADLENNEVAISRNLAEKLQVGENDNVLVRVKKASLIPMNAPFVSAEETSVSFRATIKNVVEKEELGRFNLKNSQSAPFNVYMSIERLNRLMDFNEKANNILISSNSGTEEVIKAVENHLIPEDAGLSVKYLEATDEVEISTERVFMEPKVAQTLEQLPQANPLITYFTNAIAPKNSDGIPYSFVSSLNEGKLTDEEIILNQWAADDLNVVPGDTIRLGYLEIGPLRRLTEKDSEFVLKEIVPMNKTWADSTRMPWLPGLSDAGHCREWNAGIPIDLDAIRDKDEDYWDKWGGAPKAYVSLGRAREMWENRFGVYTAVRYPSEAFDENRYLELFSENINAGDLGISVNPVREEGLVAAQNGTDFSGLFLGLSFFILLASIILTSLLFRLNMETRSSEIGVLAALGFSESQVRRMFLVESLFVALVGGLVGLGLSVLYTQGVFRVLNTLWFDIVRTNILLIQVYPATLVLGLAISLLVSTGAILISIVRYQKQKTAELQKRVANQLKKSHRIVWDIFMWIFLILPLMLLLFQLVSPGNLDSSLFFLSGGLLLTGMLLYFNKLLNRIEENGSGKIRLGKISRLNLTRNKGRSLTVVILFALGTFLVVSTGSNKLDLFANAQDQKSGTGGFLYFAETTMPVLYDMNNAEKRSEEGIYENFSAVQFRRVSGDDASCLNLNRVMQPAILGVDPEALSGHFSFATQMKELNSADPWMMLDTLLEEGVVPAIADQTVIQWGLGKKVGDELLYQNERGDTLRLKLIAGTKPSVFQGYVIISNKHFLNNFPSGSGTNIFLIGGEQENEIPIADELNSVFRDYGWEMESTARRLVEFYSVTNTYLSIFLALGALGMILGTIGLAVILARTILERRREISLMQAIGFRKRQLFILLIKEYFWLLAAGVITGFITAVVATLPALISTNADASLGMAAFVTGLILVNGTLWITALSWFSLRKRNLVSGLRTE